MQGRLSPIVDGRIQSFPWQFWRDEFPLAESIGLRLMEWTLDQHRLYENPLLTKSGQVDILSLAERHGVSIPSLTGDCFMQAPFWKASSTLREGLERDFLSIVDACCALGITYIVVPLVDNGCLESNIQADRLIGFLQKHQSYFVDSDVRIAFESDFPPIALASLMNRLDSKLFGVNYDIGNSAALGFSPREEFAAFGDRIMNVHVKDRMLGGTTVPLGSGNADFEVVFEELRRVGYSGNFIMQTARAADGAHAMVLQKFGEMSTNWINQMSGATPPQC